MDCGTQKCCGSSKSASLPVKGYGKIDTNGLMNLISSGVPLTILDARGGKYDDGKRIGSARTLSYEATKEQVVQAIPTQHSLIVVYCSNLQCPASSHLAKRLSEFGYSNILKYGEGIQEWIDAGHPIREERCC
ncbi:MAG: rhodanese-like domain-containing protein [Rhabdochlamydiaceae bacterium]|jgi:rhodanese-related sulfurtransferase